MSIAPVARRYYADKLHELPRECIEKLTRYPTLREFENRMECALGERLDVMHMAVLRMRIIKEKLVQSKM